MMKTIKCLMAGLILALLVGAVQAGEGWLTDLAAAQKMAVEKNRPILVDFSGSDWCGWCIKLDKEVFSQEAFKAYADEHLVLLLLDFPRRKELPVEQRQQNNMLMKQYGVEGFPTVLLLDKDAKEIARTGYQEGGPEAYVKHLQELMAAAKE
jgi:thioredoxin-related protein